jgi:hypothetical protein
MSLAARNTLRNLVQSYNIAGRNIMHILLRKTEQRPVPVATVWSVGIDCLDAEIVG